MPKRREEEDDDDEEEEEDEDDEGKVDERISDFIAGLLPGGGPITSKMVLFMIVLCIAAPITLVVFVGLSITAKIVSRRKETNVPPLKYAKNSQRDLDGRIVIIGAGAAGLYAGYTLKYLGVENFIILEASDVIGGRVAEKKNFIDIPLDIGAEWIHVHPKILKDLLLPFDNAAELEKELPETIDYRPQTFTTENGHSCNWMKFFYRETKFRNTTWWGYLDKFIRSQIKSHIQLNSVVETIEWGDSSDKITIWLKNDSKSFTASQVLLAVPGAVLQNEDIFFDPPLPKRKLAALNKVWFAPGLKVWIEFDERFYPDVVIPGPLLDFVRTDKLYFNAVFRKPSNRHVLCMFDVGDTAESMVKLSNAKIKKKVLKELDDIFDGKASKHFVKYYVQNWSKTPYIQSAYSYDYDDFWDDIELIQKPIGKKIYFAGEYLIKTDLDISSVHGAALSGRETAQQMIADRV